MNETNEHNPDGLTPEQYGAPEWRLLRISESVKKGDEWIGIGRPKWTPSDVPMQPVNEKWTSTYRRRVVDQSARIAELERRVEELTEEKLRVLRGGFTQICSYCGWEASKEGAKWEELQAHIAVCEKHPTSQLRAEVETLTRERDEARVEVERLKKPIRTARTVESTIELYESPKYAHIEKYDDGDYVILIAEADGSKSIYEFEGPTVSALRAQLAASEADRWQPIETAPKDGTKVLIWSYGPGIEDGYWCDTKVPKGWSAGSNCPRSPQYWQPLPQPPTIRAARAQPEDGK